MSYQRIRSLSEQETQLGSTELASLRRIWRERKASVARRETLDTFLLELKREWAIETGIIERLYQWDRGVTEVLIRQGIDASLIAHEARISQADAYHIADLIQDQQSIIDGLFDFIRRDTPLTEHYIRTLHQEFTRHQETTIAVTPAGQRIEIELRRGAYKQQPNNPRRPDGTIHEYCPPELVADEMQRLVSWYREAEEHNTAPEVLAAWLHHRFTQIHPFQDGNGRVARALATLVLLQADMFPLVIRDSERTSYLDALEAADRGELAPLVNLFVKRQRDAILRAIGLEQKVQRDRRLQTILGAAVDTLKRQKEAHVAELQQVFDTAGELERIATKSLAELAKQITEQIKPLSIEAQAFFAEVHHCSQDREESRYYFREIVDIAHKFGYFANTNTYRAWVRLLIQTRDPFYVLISFHGLGREFEGVLVASALSFRRIPDENDKKQVEDLHPVMAQIFQCNYAEPADSTHKRFKSWLHEVETLAMAEWQRSLTV